MTQPDPHRAHRPAPERRSPRPPPRGQHPSLKQANASPVANAAPEDFLGLDIEVQRSRPQEQIVRHPAHLFTPPPAQPDMRVSTNTTLIPRSAVFAPIPPPPAAPAPQPQRAPVSSAHADWMRVAKESLGALEPPEAPPRAGSWLLALDDARAGRAGVEPVVHDPSRRAATTSAPAQLNTSFAEELPVSSRTMPWLIRGLIGVAAGSFLFVVGHTVLSPQRPEPPALVMPPVAKPQSVSEPRAELADPGPRETSPTLGAVAGRGGKNRPAKPVPMSPARPFVPAVETKAPVQEDVPPTFIEIAPPDFAPRMDPNGVQPAAPNASNEPQTSAVDYALPPWYPEMVSTTPLARDETGPREGELAASPERKARVQSYLMQQSRGAVPIADASDSYTPSVSGASISGSGGGKRASTSRATLKAAPVEKHDAPSDASGVWDGAVVPVDQIASKLKIATPRVGLVRVTLASGDVKEGRLSAVGQGQVWLERERGVEAIPRSRIERLEQISAPQDVLAYPGEKLPAKTALAHADARVRVRTAGGLFYGKIVAREGDTITLVTDEGARVTIEGGTVEAAPERKTVVKRAAAPKPVKPKPQPIPSAHGEEPGLEPADQGHSPTPQG